VQVPSVSRVTVVPTTVHTDVVALPNVTGRLDVAVADTVAVPSDSGVSAGALKVIVCPAASMCAEPSDAFTEAVARGPGLVAGDEAAPVRGAGDRVSPAEACGRGRSDRFPAADGDALPVPGASLARSLVALADFDVPAGVRFWVDATTGGVPSATSAAAAGTAIRPDPAANRTSSPSPAATFRACVEVPRN
jgi:hypothetical protein